MRIEEEILHNGVYFWDTKICQTFKLNHNSLLDVWFFFKDDDYLLHVKLILNNNSYAGRTSNV